MIKKSITVIEVDERTEQAIKNYICGNIASLSELATYISSFEGKTYDRQSAVNLVATILPYWYKIGKVDIGTHTAETVGEL